MKRLVALVALAACGHAAPAPRDDTPKEIRGLRAWARLYGVLRYWHPSDEAAAIDWDRVAVLGAQRVRHADEPVAIEAALAPIVAAVAPTARLAGPGEALADAPEIAAGGDQLVAWQYLGAGFGAGQPGVYEGKRTHRDLQLANADGWTSFAQALDATPYRGKAVRFRMFVRADGASGSLWVRVDRGTEMGFFQNTDDRPVQTGAWTEVTIDGTVDADASQLVVGGMINGVGAVWFDDARLEIAGAEVALTNPGFDADTAGWTGGVEAPDSGFTWSVDDGGHTGRAVRLAAAVTSVHDDLFEGHAETGDAADVDLGGGLRARVPLAVWSLGGHTQPAADASELAAALEALPAPAVADADARIADVIVAWATMGQFSPYFVDTGVDWDEALDRALLDALDDTTAADHQATLDRLGASLEDGHVFANVPEAAASTALPLQLGWVEDRLVVLASATKELVAGDVITSIDGVAAADALDAMIARCSGSPQWRRVVALQRLVVGNDTRPVALAIVHDGAARDVAVARVEASPPDGVAGPPLGLLDAGVWYVDLSRVTSADLEPRWDELAAARAVIFDLRGYPSIDIPSLGHLLASPEHDRWMHTPRWSAPALPGQLHQPGSWEDLGWDLEPVAPRLTGQVVFLAGPGAISFAESILGYVEALGLPIVGEPSAGTNGNIRNIELPTGASIYLSGMRVTRHDGTRSHLLGIRPTITVTPTIAGIRAGRDEVLDRAVELVTRSAPD